MEDLVAGLSCFLGAGMLYLLGRSNRKEAELLKQLPRVNQLKELEQTLPEIEPLMVTICGRVGSDKPISCKLSGLRAVIVENTVEQHFLQRVKSEKKKKECNEPKKKKRNVEPKKEKKRKRNDGDYWIKKSALMLSTSKQVPWYLDDGTGRVFVVGAYSATDFQLTAGSVVYEKSKRSLEREKLDYNEGLKMLGVTRYEDILPTGTSLTVVGEAVRGKKGTIRIQRPRNGPFYVSQQTIDQLIFVLGEWARACKYASSGLSLFGVFFITKQAIQYILEKKHCWEKQKRDIELSLLKLGELERMMKELRTKVSQAQNRKDKRNK